MLTRRRSGHDGFNGGRGPRIRCPLGLCTTLRLYGDLRGEREGSQHRTGRIAWCVQESCTRLLAILAYDWWAVKGHGIRVRAKGCSAGSIMALRVRICGGTLGGHVLGFTRCLLDGKRFVDLHSVVDYRS